MQTYALACYRLPETHALQRCLLTSPSNTGLWGIITVAKPLWTYRVVKTPVMPPSEFTVMHFFHSQITFCWDENSLQVLTSSYEALTWERFLCLGWDLKYIKEHDHCHPSQIVVLWTRHWLVAQESRFQVSVLQNVWMSSSCISGLQTIGHSEEQLPRSLLLDLFHFV